MNFPLYTIINDKLTEDLKPLTKGEKEKMISKIKQLDDNQHEHIYALIKVHHLENENEFKLPYGMKNLKLGIRVDIDTIPIKLQYIIKEFLVMNQK